MLCLCVFVFVFVCVRVYTKYNVISCAGHAAQCSQCTSILCLGLSLLSGCQRAALHLRQRLTENKMGRLVF